MGLFSKKVCSVCGTKLGILDLMAISLTDGYLCGKCEKKCSRFLDRVKVENKWSAVDVQEHFKELDEQKKRLQTEFKETDSVLNSKSGANPGSKILVVDRDHGWFHVGESSEIFRLDQIRDYTVDIFCKDGSDADFHITGFKAPRNGMKVPGHLETLVTISVFIIMNDEQPYATRLEIPIATSGAGMLDPYPNFVNNVYNTAAEIYDLLAGCTGIRK